MAIEPALEFNLFSTGDNSFTLDDNRFGFNIGVQAFIGRISGGKLFFAHPEGKAIFKLGDPSNWYLRITNNYPFPVLTGSIVAHL